MSLNLLNYEERMKDAVKHFWATREEAKAKNQKSGKRDSGNRGAVTNGKNMDGFVHLIEAIVEANGLPKACVISKGRSRLTLPGYFRPTKNWDILILDEGNLVGVVEFKSQVGSLGNNFNNRCEEAIGSITDIKTALKEEVIDLESIPFMGYLMLVEDSEKSNSKVKIDSPLYEVDEIFKNTSYLERYAIFCHRLVTERLYDAAGLVATCPDTGITEGTYRSLDKLTSVKSFVSKLAGSVASYVAAK